MLDAVGVEVVEHRARDAAGDDDRRSAENISHEDVCAAFDTRSAAVDGAEVGQGATSAESNAVPGRPSNAACVIDIAVGTKGNSGPTAADGA